MTDFENEQAWRRRMQFLCKRGNLETELLLSAYSRTLPIADRTKRQLFERLLSESDQALFNWLLMQSDDDNVAASEIPADYHDLIEAIRNNYLIANQ